MRAYRVTFLVIDHDLLGSVGVEDELRAVNWPNDCIQPRSIDVIEADIGDWSDDHPLNYNDGRSWPDYFSGEHQEAVKAIEVCINEWDEAYRAASDFSQKNHLSAVASGLRTALKILKTKGV